MCGRYTHALTWSDIVRLYELTLPEVGPREHRQTWNAAPTQPLPIIRPIEGGGRELIIAGWGLIPGWLKNLDEKAVSTINARAESVRDKPTFRQSFERRRCLVPATGWYEWQKVGPKKRPIYMRATAEPFAFAGIWDRWAGNGGPGFISYAIVTTDAAPSVSAYHHRMPVVLEAAQFDQWMRGTPDEAAALMRPYAGALEAWEVSARVNGPKLNDPDLMRPVDAAAAAAPVRPPTGMTGTLL
ncbi:SOS response-associated peptidase [Vineibacter terrae]|uniref:Abasic site processing protein n=1 Tax=Vineibacter terrae TaxID=2586908 RepID=A0A5C8PGZ9_9HYPH|nr:SOS response-associated peptidase [Vineibacter terrae]TXL72574.1 SOS response-associated peptidase [Vineibacter terrae]